MGPQITSIYSADVRLHTPYVDPSGSVKDPVNIVSFFEAGVGDRGAASALGFDEAGFEAIRFTGNWD